MSKFNVLYLSNSCLLNITSVSDRFRAAPFGGETCNTGLRVSGRLYLRSMECSVVSLTVSTKMKGTEIKRNI